MWGFFNVNLQAVMKIINPIWTLSSSQLGTVYFCRIRQLTLFLPKTTFNLKCCCTGLTYIELGNNITVLITALLPVSIRIDSKVLLLIYRALHNLAPSYIIDCRSFYVLIWTLRSSTAFLLKFLKCPKRSLQRLLTDFMP